MDFSLAGNCARVSAPSDVTHPPADMPFVVGQEPSGSCWDRRKSRPPDIPGCAKPVWAKPSKAQQVGSTRLWPPFAKAQPPSEFCASARMPRTPASGEPAARLDRCGLTGRFILTEVRILSNEANEMERGE